jgi:tellurite resistance-related uncharacterized protein
LGIDRVAYRCLFTGDIHTVFVATTTICGFHQDAEGNWVAELACGHAQHVRHRPPWECRPWVASEVERAQKVGADMDCPLCRMPALPPGTREYKRSATFTELNVPAGLLQNHRTKEGTWALIVVEAGELEYTIESPLVTFLLTPRLPGIIAPTVAHRVKVLGAVRFYVAFLTQ